ncbi:MAG: phasin family protein [Hyphomonadaceae bacterium]|nr:phasin family protein [Hyphomonadaceae bacterium]
MAAKKVNGSSEGVAETLSFLQSPAANGFLLSQKLALEATRFWARRTQAYAEQAQALVACREPAEFVNAQTRFFERMREDYASETLAVADMLTPEPVERDAVID